MKILLIGEFSGLHNNLRDGLVELGHHVTIASFGDGWKQFTTDILLSKTRHHGLLGKIEKNSNLFKLIDTAGHYDIIQLISYRQTKPIVNFIFLKKLYKVNPNIFIVAAGTSPITVRYHRKHFEYCPYSISQEEKMILDCSEISKSIRDSKNLFLITEEQKCLFLAKKIIPSSVSYLNPYQNFYNCINSFIPMPINTKKYAKNPIFMDNQHKKIKILYGISRECFKGHVYIQKALDLLQKSHANKVEISIIKRLAFDEYLRQVKGCDILIDQCKSYGYGMNALLGLAMGKIVFSGAEEVESNQLKDCPIINIRPNHLDIYSKLINIIDNSAKIEEIKNRSQSFAKETHHYIEIAKKYIKVWLS